MNRSLGERRGQADVAARQRAAERNLAALGKHAAQLAESAPRKRRMVTIDLDAFVAAVSELTAPDNRIPLYATAAKVAAADDDRDRACVALVAVSDAIRAQQK